ncbi:MAG: bifunctional diaminohydroxyphosphoribosylaminopyrimidine deaminase/5-amino-6-(5-phosphoribosylamino)uracil reductase RibD [Acidobacteria bacterium]|nr:MAG: bifunctional diaminohydroxyphosphoribosylaminopyrimidine deaminase/5-amino-6-(5-phosphoribosylamino)uracil reductase RibD [Acidobacteriota bacterium]
MKELDSATKSNDIDFTQRALALASRGVGLVSPNPVVGCVIVAGDEVVGEGFYTYDGVTHAEVIALDAAGERARGATAYVSLEPHSHHGKTPPCTEALITAGISRVVCPIEDPNPLVSGKGFSDLRKAGIEVVTGICKAEAATLNEKFSCWHKKGRPFVHVKLAASLDGRISLSSSVSTYLSSDEARKRVQELRHEYDAILVGGTTVAVDDPSLTDRSGLPRRRPLVRVILDGHLATPVKSNIVQTAKETPTIVFTSDKGEAAAELNAAGVEVIFDENGGHDLAFVLSELKKREIQSVLVEGGSAVAGSFRDADLIDKLSIIYAPLVIGGDDAPTAFAGSGASSLSDALRLARVNVGLLGRDIEVTGYPEASDRP